MLNDDDTPNDQDPNADPWNRTNWVNLSPPARLLVWAVSIGIGFACWVGVAALAVWLFR